MQKPIPKKPGRNKNINLYTHEATLNWIIKQLPPTENPIIGFIRTYGGVCGFAAMLLFLEILFLR